MQRKTDIALVQDQCRKMRKSWNSRIISFGGPAPDKGVGSPSKVDVLAVVPEANGDIKT